MNVDYIGEAFSLEGQVAVVTGASRGLGQAMAVGLAKAGASIVAVATKVDNLDETRRRVEELGRFALPVCCDSREREAIDETIASAIDLYGKIDILVNNAGTIRRAPTLETSDEDWEAVIDTNLNGVFHFCRAAGQHMVPQRSGKIINIASLLSFIGGITVPAYAASKGGVAQLTKALANEWASHNVQVNAIAPGYFETDNTANLRDDKPRFTEINARIPAGRWGKPEDLVGATIFLASPASDYVNGHILLVDGGFMAR
jgi:2-deoxy-D-gluconate 3-dehydrogenase